MDKEEILLKNYALLSKNPRKNMDALKSSIGQLIAINPKLGIRCWKECLEDNMIELEIDFGKSDFPYNSIGYSIVRDFESEYVSNRSFVEALGVFAKDKALLEILYSKSPIYSYCGARIALSYLIRKDRLQEADNILAAIYKNKGFAAYSNLWDSIIDKFKYGNYYNPGMYSPVSQVQPEHIRDFCISWIERIKDEEEQASAMTFAMKMFE